MNQPTRMMKPPPPADREARLDSPEAQSFIKGEEAGPMTQVSATVQEAEQTTSVAGYPWEGRSTQHYKQKPFRMLEDEAEMLNYLGETTYGETSQSIFLAGIRAEISRRMRDRGFNVTQDRKTGKLTVATGRRTTK